jgi:fructose-1,6-bisphosphatase/inositol monophosphatase family enzyme
MDLERALLACACVIHTMQEQGESLRSWKKADDSLVTSLDIACEEIIGRELAGGCAVLSEETVSSHSMIDTSDEYILCDPIDGTTVCRRFFRGPPGQLGFGPLLGVVKDGKLQAASYYNVLQCTLVSSVRGKGVRWWKGDPRVEPPPPFEQRQIRELLSTMPKTLDESVLLFYIRSFEEAQAVYLMKDLNRILTCNRFGGFANDCCRLASGDEHLLLQLSVKPWDFSATLFLEESGFEMVMDPFNKCLPHATWRIASQNPLIAAPSHLVSSFLDALHERVHGP